MENSETIKRSIRIPIDLHNKLEWKSKLLGKTVNQVILEDLGRLNGVDVGNRKRGRRWY
jgi:hypothetical protein